MQALENVHNKIETLERYSRLHDQAIAAQEKEMSEVKKFVKVSEDDRVGYKAYTENRFKNMEEVVTKELERVVTLIPASGTDKVSKDVFENSFRDLDQKIGLIGAQLSEVLSAFNQRGGPPQGGPPVYEMGTPQNAARGSRDPPPEPTRAGPVPAGIFA